MTEKCCNYTRSYLFYRLGEIKVCTVLSTIFAFLGFPIIFLLNLSEGIVSDIFAPFLILSILCIMGSCVMSYVTPLVALKHLYTKNIADNILSLPLTANQRFIGDISAIIISFAGPVGASLIVDWVLELFGSFEITGYIAKAFLIMLVFIMLNTAIITCCGRIAEAIIYPFALNIIAPLIVASSLCFAFKNQVGVYNLSGEIINLPFMKMWPFGASLAFLAGEGTDLVFINIICIIIYTVAAYFGYTRRHGENIGKTFVFRYSYAVISILMCAGVVFMYSLIYSILAEEELFSIASVMAVAVIMFIALLVMEIINYKKIKSFASFVLRGAGTLAVCLLLCFLLPFTEGFGATYYVPEVSEIEEIHISGCTVSYGEYENDRAYHRRITVRRPETMEPIVNEHQLCIDRAKTGEISYGGNNFDVEYVLKNGRTIRRDYYFDERTFSPNFWNDLESSADYRLQDIYAVRNFNLGIETTTEIHIGNTVKSFNARNKEFDSEKLLEALEKDLIADEDFNNPTGWCLMEITFGYTDAQLEAKYGIKRYGDTYDDKLNTIANFTVYDDYVNTLEYLKPFITIPEV